MSSNLLVCCALLLACACQAPAPVLVHAPDTLLSCPLNAFPFVDGRIGDKQVPVVFDTGAERSVIDAELTQTLGLATKAYLLPLRFALTGGAQHARRYAPVDGLEIGDVRIDGLELPLLDLGAGAQLHGGALVIGCDVLRRCRILFDAPSHAIRFLDTATPQALDARLQELHPGASWTCVPVHWDGNRPRVTIGMDGREDARVLLDTGALQTAFDAELVRQWHLTSMTGSDNLVFVDGLRIGPWRARFVAQVAPPGLEPRFGFDVVGRLVFVWDGPADRLLVMNPKGGEPDTFDAGAFIESILEGMGLEPARTRK